MTREATDGKIPAMEWPSKGAISIQHLSVRYAADLPDVLHDVSLEIEVGELTFTQAIHPMTTVAWDASRPSRLDRIRQVDARTRSISCHPVARRDYQD